MHLYCSFPPRLSISTAVTHLQSLSARALFREFPELRARLWGGALWEGGYFEGGYFVRTVSESITGQTVRRYIRRHRDGEAKPADEDEDDAGQLDLLFDLLFDPPSEI